MYHQEEKGAISSSGQQASAFKQNMCGCSSGFQPWWTRILPAKRKTLRLGKEIG
jgi:hypothetical protein